MWILNQFLRAGKEKATAQVGSVTANGEVQAQTPYSSVKQCGPWGVQWRAPQGAQAVLMKTDSGEICVGTVCSTETLQPGELKLVSQGGAEVYLKASGEVVINGQVFPAVKQEG